MKLFISNLCGVALLFAATAGYAEEFQRGYVFDCQYLGTADSKGGPSQCAALVNVCQFRLATTKTPAPGCVDWLITTCSDGTRSNGEAVHTTTTVNTPYGTLEYQVIAGMAAGSPAIRYVSQDPGTTNPFYITSWMKSGDAELRGFCEVALPPPTK